MLRLIIDPNKLSRSVQLLNIVVAHTETCPTKKIARCPGSGEKKESNKDPCAKFRRGSGIGDGSGFRPGPGPKRALQSGPCRFGFVPEEWFTFFYPQTGVSGPYIFGIVLGNYLLSKEKFIMEHEYYSGLSAALMCYLIVTRLGPMLGKSLDKEVDSIAAEYQKSRDDEIAFYQSTINSATQTQTMAKGQELLIAAKKENVKIQLEAVYRERMMHVYRGVKRRLDYHVIRHRAEIRVHQKWMIQWILDKVMKSITPEFEKQALDKAIRDLAAFAGRKA